MLVAVGDEAAGQMRDNDYNILSKFCPLARRLITFRGSYVCIGFTGPGRPGWTKEVQIHSRIMIMAYFVFHAVFYGVFCLFSSALRADTYHSLIITSQKYSSNSCLPR